MEGLGQITLNMLESLTPTERNNTNMSMDISMIDIERVNLFGLIRMLETTLVNVHRIHIVWDFVVRIVRDIHYRWHIWTVWPTPSSRNSDSLGWMP